MFDIFHNLALAIESYMAYYFISLHRFQISTLGDDNNCCLFVVLLDPHTSQCHSDDHSHSLFSHLAAVEFEARNVNSVNKDGFATVDIFTKSRTRLLAFHHHAMWPNLQWSEQAFWMAH